MISHFFILVINIMFDTFIKKAVNIIHIIILLIPIIIYLLPSRIVKPYIHWILFMMILIPLHWPFFDNKCIFTYISSYLGDYDNEELETEASFTESNFKWLLNPIMNFFGMEWDNKNLHKILTLYALINITVVWFYAFYICENKKIPDMTTSNILGNSDIENITNI